MSHCTVPTWNPSYQRQEHVVEAEEANKYPHLHNQQIQINHLLPMYDSFLESCLFCFSYRDQYKSELRFYWFDTCVI